MKNEMDSMKAELQVCFRALHKNWVMIFLCTLLGLLIGSVMAIIPPPDVYQARGSISKTAATSPSNLSIDTFRDLLSSKNVLDGIANRLGSKIVSPSEISSMVYAASNESENILYITATHTDPSFAIEVTNVATEVMVRRINEIYSNAGVVVLDQATSAMEISNWARSVTMYRLLGALLGALGCCTLVIVLALTSDKTINLNDCTMGGKYSLIGVIPHAPPPSVEDRF